MNETRDARLRRLAMRSMRRGIREMDLILSHFACRELGGLSDADLAAYERLLEESDHDLLLWITGAGEAPAALRGIVARVAAGAVAVGRPRG